MRISQIQLNTANQLGQIGDIKNLLESDPDIAIEKVVHATTNYLTWNELN